MKNKTENDSECVKSDVGESSSTDDLELSRSIIDEEREYAISSQFASMVTIDMICEQIGMYL